VTQVRLIRIARIDGESGQPWIRPAGTHHVQKSLQAATRWMALGGRDSLIWPRDDGSIRPHFTLEATV
jgi:hypothetical protein